MTRLRIGSILRTLTSSILLSALAGAGCASSPPQRGCQGSCQNEGDCEAGLSCADMVGKGWICVPTGCTTCVGSKPNCTFEQITSTNGDISCSFVACE